MKTFLTAAAVLALSAGAAMADKVGSKMADPKPEPRVYEPAAPAFNWTGGYMGLGLTYGTSSHTPDMAGAILPDASGFGLGGLVGYNWQSGNMVFGAEVAGDLSRISGSEPCANPIFECTSEINNVISARLRAGVAADNTLIFATAGLASGSFTHSTELPPAPADEDTQRVNGWMIGAGIEQAISDTMSIRGDLEHYRFKSQTFALDVPYNDVRARMNKARLSVIFRF